MMEARGHIHLLRHNHYSLSKTWIWTSVGDEWRIAGELRAAVEDERGRGLAEEGPEGPDESQEEEHDKPQANGAGSSQFL